MMIIIQKSPWIWCVIAGALLFAVSGLMIRGNVLNESVPGGFLGWVFWAIIIALICRFLLLPVAEFASLPQWKSEEELSRMDGEKRLRFLERYARRVLDAQKKYRVENASLNEKLKNIDGALSEMDGEYRIQRLRESLADVRGYLETDVCGKIVSEHMKFAAVAVVVSQRGFLDSIVVFVVQLKLIVALCKALGHRPSWAFVSCCMIWGCMNSVISMIFDETKIVEGALSSFQEILGLQSSGTISEIPGVKIITSSLLQALTAASSVYVTGAIVRSRLLGDGRKKTLKDFLQLRLGGYKEPVALVGEFVRAGTDNISNDAQIK